MYNGNVEVGGPAHVRELSQLIISKMAVGSLANNVYLLKCRETGVQLMIDAAAESTNLLTLVGADGLEYVLTTHGHPDHWQALDEVARKTEAITAAPMADVPSIATPIDQPLADGDVVQFGLCELEVITVGGHTPGCSMFLYRDPTGHEHLFSGDALFPGGVGKTLSPTDFTTLFEGVRDRVFDRLSDLTWVYPGHGNDTTLGDQRPHLDEWRARGW